MSKRYVSIRLPTTSAVHARKQPLIIYTHKESYYAYAHTISEINCHQRTKEKNEQKITDAPERQGSAYAKNMNPLSESHYSLDYIHIHTSSSSNTSLVIHTPNITDNSPLNSAGEGMLGNYSKSLSHRDFFPRGPIDTRFSAAAPKKNKTHGNKVVQQHNRCRSAS